MKEIGGYFELETFARNEYYKDAIALNTARNAFVYLAKAKNISKVYLPYYLCDSVYKVCEREKIDYEFYHIDSDFLPLFQKKLENDEYLYVVNFFGQLSDDVIKKLKAEHKNIIVDNVQAFFSDPVEDIDTLYSCRKFFGVPDGAYLISDCKRIAAMDTDVSMERMKHILGRFEGNSASDYYGDFQKSDEFFEELPVKHMSKLTHNILSAVDYETVKNKRNSNWKLLHSELGETNKLNLVDPDAPYMYPYYCEDGINLRKALVFKKIFIPTLWPNVLDLQGCELEVEYAENILPLPIDQRYTEEDMKKIIYELKMLKG